ncbi:FAD-dependent oxidoreductase [candidate division CSSED10-310 bacterium]|uniref:FAD-dependent oxidoreductase n=1 Tax=candidate division CSSED10-310 bacterium TaxID=2855610 RepID=A0ABV6YTC1_UNCC1
MCSPIKLRSNRKVSGEELGYLRYGFQTLIDKLKLEVERSGTVILGQKVIKIDHDEQCVHGVQTERNHYRAKSVVSTISPQLVQPLADFPAAYQARLQKNKSQSVVCALFGMKVPLIDTYWLNIRSETLPFAVIIEHTNFHDLPGYDGQKILYVAGYQDGAHHPFYQLSEEEIIERYLQGLEQEFGLKRSNILWHKLAKASAVGPIYTVNFLENVLPHQTGIEGLIIGGMMTSYPERGISASIEQGEHCAALSLAYLEQQ